MMMLELGTTHLCCTPSYALYLGETLEKMRIDRSQLKLKAGCFGAEPWTEEMRGEIERLLDEASEQKLRLTLALLRAA